MTEISHSYAHVNGLRMHYAEAGRKDGPCVIMCYRFTET